jgi:hypothetical protein
MSTSEIIKRQIQGYLADSGLTVDEFLELIGMKRSTFYNKLNGETPWMLVEVMKLSEVMGCSVESIVMQDGQVA